MAPLNKAATALLARSTPVTTILRPYAEGAADWPTTLAALTALRFPAATRPSTEDVMGETEAGRERYADATIPAPLPDEGTFGEVVAARDVGILTAEQLAEVIRTPQRA